MESSVEAARLDAAWLLLGLALTLNDCVTVSAPSVTDTVTVKLSVKSAGFTIVSWFPEKLSCTSGVPEVGCVALSNELKLA